ncbi:glycosyltransferase [Providencia sp. PROV188]|uniref:glycosyltransferase n=1 Tax=Providencia sp. PROV188 TaxID=2939731 RepID=UPI0022DDF17E|nr:glycosyltransferase [Providencia sp. PROV188]WBM60745.1 glycosyltransferase [Providencia sp. PROV188]
MIFVSGNVNSSYRAQNIIKLITDNNIEFSHIPFFLTIGKNYFIKRAFAIISMFFLIPARVLLLVMSKKIVILPMNHTVFSLFDTIIGKIFNKEIILEFYISTYDTAVNDRGEIAPKSKKAKRLLFIEKKLTQYATNIVCLNEAEKNYYLKFMHSSAKSKVISVPLVIDRIKSRNQIKMSAKKFQLCWWGNYIPLHGLEKIIKAIKLIDGYDITFYIFGNNEEKSKPYQDLANELEINNKIIFNNDFTFKNGKLPEFLINNCDLALGNFGSSEKATTVLVNKVVDAIALNLPCLTMQTKACDEFFIANENIFLTKENPTPEDIANAIIEIIDNKDNLFEISKNGHDIYNHYFSPEAFSKKYLPLIK